MILTSDPKRLAQVLFWHRTGHTARSIAAQLGLSATRAGMLIHKAEFEEAARLRRERAKDWRTEVALLITTIRRREKNYLRVVAK